MKLKRKAKPGLKRNGRGTVMIIAALLSASAILRLGSEAGSAVAEAVSAPTHAEEAEVLVEPPVDEPGQMDRVEMGRLLSALRDREARIAQREEKIAMRSKALSVADSEIAKRMAALAQMEENLRRTLALADGAAEKDLSRLTTVYENMKPKEAAVLFEAMEPDFAAGFLGRMRPDAAASVLAGLSPEAAYSISVILAGRNATAPKS